MLQVTTMKSGMPFLIGVPDFLKTTEEDKLVPIFTLSRLIRQFSE